MSTATAKQTPEERDRVIAEWDSKKGALAETQKNLHIMAEALIGYQKKYGDFLSVEILNAVVKANAHQLDWLAPAPAPTPKPKGDVKNRLWNLGVEVARGTSMAHKEAEKKQIESQETAIIVRAHLLKEQSQLLEERTQAEYGFIVMHRLGIDHYRTGEARKAAKAKLLPKIADFNKRCVNSGNDNLTI